MQPQKLVKRLLMIGCGHMGGALLYGWLEKQLLGEVVVVDPFTANMLDENEVVSWYSDAADIPADATFDLVVIAIKPQLFAQVLPAYAERVRQSCIVSIAAGKSLDEIAAYFPNCPVVRVMPNLPASVGQAASACIANSLASEQEKQVVSGLMDAVGSSVWLQDEAQMHLVTALSGSGPAYVFHLVEAMEQAAASLGLPADIATTLARQTVAGAGGLLASSSDGAGDLREQVTSPGGTTAAGLDVLMDQQALQKLLQNTLRAAAKRSEELS